MLEALRAACPEPPETPDLSSHSAAQQATEAVARAVTQRAALENDRARSLPNSCSRLICESVRDVHGMRRASAPSRLGVALGKKLWRAARARNQRPAAPKRRGRKSIVDDPEVRERVRRYLEQNCTPSSKYMLSRLTGKGKEKVRGEGVVQIMALSANRKRLWRASPDMMRLMKYRSWLHHLRKHHTHFRRCKKRVVHFTRP